VQILSDEKLMEQLQQGRVEALDELYRRYARRLYAFCYHSTRSNPSCDPEDLVQDVFIRIIKSAHTYNPAKASFRTWMFRVARNRCIDVIRKGQRFRFVPLGKRPEENDLDGGLALEDVLIDPTQDVAGTMIKTSTSQAIRDCIGELKQEEERQAILLYYLGGKVYREIGDVLGKSTSMARNYVKAAQEKVKRCLERKGIGPEP
jgi:RNA polymerase sigma factor (sigma-70 family)